MMTSLFKKYFQWLFPLSFIVLLIVRFIINDSTYTDVAFYVLIACICAFLLIFNKNLFLSLCIFFIPLSVNIAGSSSANSTLPSELMIFLLAIAAVFIGISRPVYFKKILFHPISLLLLLDLAWMIISSLNSEMFLISIKRVVVRFLFLLVFYLLTAHWIIKKENLIKFFFLYCLGLIVPIIFTEYKHELYNFNPKVVYELCLPFYNEHTIYGASIAFLIPFLLILAINRKSFHFSKGLAIFVWTLLFTFILAEILSFSRAAWLSLCASFLMFIFLKLKFKFWHFLIVLLVMILVFTRYAEPLYTIAKDNNNISNKGEIKEHILSVGNLNSDPSNLERINRWLCAFRMFEDRPVTGYGPGTYQFVYGPYQSVYEMTYISTTAGDKGNAHSEFLGCLSETGLPGLISFLLWTLAIIGYGISAYHRAKDPVIRNIVLAALLGFITFFVHGLVNSFIDQVKLASLVFGSLAIIVVADITNKTETPIK